MYVGPKLRPGTWAWARPSRPRRVRGGRRKSMVVGVGMVVRVGIVGERGRVW